MISVGLKGSFKKLESFLGKMSKENRILEIFNRYGAQGVTALARATPVNTGLVAHAWGFEVIKKGSVYSLIWTNADIENGFPVAVMIQHGYATGTGGYVEGIDYINPALRPVFEKIATEVWRVVTTA